MKDLTRLEITKNHIFSIGLIIFFIVINLGILYVFNRPQPKVMAPATSSGKAAIGGGFTLTDSQGKTVRTDDFRGYYMLVFFGFTHCPDICPTVLTTITQALRGNQVVPIFITTDPERDTPKVLAQYKKNFHPRLVMLTGSEEQIRNVAAEYKAYYEKTAVDADGNYNVNHSGYIYLMGPDGAYIKHYPASITVDALKADLQAHTKP